MWYVWECVAVVEAGDEWRLVRLGAELAQPQHERELAVRDGVRCLRVEVRVQPEQRRQHVLAEAVVDAVRTVGEGRRGVGAVVWYVVCGEVVCCVCLIDVDVVVLLCCV